MQNESTGMAMPQDLCAVVYMEALINDTLFSSLMCARSAASPIGNDALGEYQGHCVPCCEWGTGKGEECAKRECRGDYCTEVEKHSIIALTEYSELSISNEI